VILNKSTSDIIEPSLVVVSILCLIRVICRFTCEVTGYENRRCCEEMGDAMSTMVVEVAIMEGVFFMLRRRRGNK
jgi:hypothetical protein